LEEGTEYVDVSLLHYRSLTVGMASPPTVDIMIDRRRRRRDRAVPINYCNDSKGVVPPFAIFIQVMCLFGLIAEAR